LTKTEDRSKGRRRRHSRRAGTAVLGAALLMGACGGSAATGPEKAVSTAPATADAAYASPVLLGRLQDEALSESSGLVASRKNAGLLWTHNDAGDGANLYCLTQEAKRCGTWRVADAEAQDWEDIAAGPGPVAGERYLYIGDIGDNDEARADVVVYRLPEPTAPMTGGDEIASTAPADAIRLRYDDGPRDAEALLVHPASGDLYVVTKDRKDAGVYKASVGSAALTRIADFDLGGGEVVTGADVSPDGTRVVVVTKLQAHELQLPAASSGFDAIWQQPRRPVALGKRDQGEAIAYRLDADALLTTSEGASLPLHAVKMVPAAKRRG
jgi:hypothetical protein